MVVVPDGMTIKQALMKMLIEATLAKGEQLKFEEVKRDLSMPNPNDFAPGFGSFQEAAKKAWQTAKGVLAVQRETETETGEIATEKERESKMARQRGTGAKKAGRPTKYSDDQIVAMMEGYFKSHGKLPDLATFKRDHPDVAIQPGRFQEIVRLTEPDVLGWVYEGTSGDGELEASEESDGSGAILASEEPTEEATVGSDTADFASDKNSGSEEASDDDGELKEADSAKEPKRANDEAIPEARVEATEKLVEAPETADSAASAEVADPEEDAVVEAPQGEVVAIDSGTEPEGAEPEGKEPDGSGAILAPEGPAEEGIVGPETDGPVSGEDPDGKGAPDDEDKPEEVDSAEEPEKIDGKVVPVLDDFDGYRGVASCYLSGDGYNVDQRYASCGGERNMTLSLYTIPTLHAIPTAGCGSIHLSVVISCDRNPSAGLQCDGEADACLVMNEAKTTFHISGMGLSKYSLNRNVRCKTTSITVITTDDRSLTIDFNGLAKITREDVADDASGEFALAMEATVGAVCMYGGCESEAKSDSAEDPHNA